LIEDSLAEDTYGAQLAGLFYSVNSDSTGLIVSVGGYSDKLSLLLATVLERLVAISFQEDRLRVKQEEVKREVTSLIREAIKLFYSLSACIRTTILDNRPISRLILPRFYFLHRFGHLQRNSLSCLVSKYIFHR
jgi:hypothetical protein